jgi:hypothetical protein
MTVVAFVTDLMDRSRITAAVPETIFARATVEADGADYVIVDLARFADDVPAIRAATRGIVVAFGPHVDDDRLAAAADAGADRVLRRSAFFRDPAAAVTGRRAQPSESPEDNRGEVDG